MPSVDSSLGVVHPDGRPAMEGWLQACVSGKRPGGLECRAVLPDGSGRLLYGRGDLQGAPGHVPALVPGTVQDITEGKRVEAALRESEERLRQALDTAHM